MALEYKTISVLDLAAAAADTDLFEIEQGGISKRLPYSSLKGDIETALEPELEDYVADKYYTQSAIFTATGTSKQEVYPVTTAAASFAGNIPAAANWSGKRIKVIKVDTGAGICTVTPAGAETFQGATAFPLRKQWDFIELESDGTLIYVVDSLATLDSAALAVNTVQSLAHGTGIIPRGLRKSLVCTSTELNYSANDEIDNWNDFIGTNRSASVTVDATNISVITVSDSGGATLTVLNKTTKAYSLITMNKWIIRTRYSI